MAEKDAKLATALKQAKLTPMFFAFVAKGANDGVLIVGKKKASAKEINEAKEESGGKKVIRGRCVNEDGKLVFEVAKEPASTLAKQLKNVIHESAGMILHVETRVAADLDEEEVETESESTSAIPATSPAAQVPPAPPPPPDPAEALFAAKFKALAPVIQMVEGIKNPQTAQANQTIAEANELFRTKQYAGAVKALDVAQGLLKEALTAAKSAPTPVASATPTPDAQAAARFATRLKALAPVMQKVEQTGSPQAAAVKQQIADGNKLYVAKQYQAANEALDRADVLVKQVLTAALKPPPAAAADLQGEWESKVIALEPRVLEAQKKRAGEAKWMTMFMSGQDLGSNGDFAKALVVLNKLEAQLNAAPVVSPGLDAALAKWSAVQTKVVESLKTLEGHIRAMNDPDGNGAIILVKAIQSNLTVRPATAQAVTELERYITIDAIVKDAEEPNGFGVRINIRTTLLPALASIRAALAA